MDATERRERAGAEAARWFVCLQAEDLPASIREEYIDWLRDSPTHVAEMLRVARVHGSLEQFERWINIDTRPSAGGAPIGDNVVEMAVSGRSAHAGIVDRKEGDPAGNARRKRFGVVAAAATVGALAIGAATLLLPELQGKVIDTERGERREVLLSDGSVVQVDAETRLRVDFGAHARRVQLERGRALFRVAKDAGRPFVVRSDGTSVRAVGTAFGVERQRAGIVVTVSEGKVAIEGPAEKPPVSKGVPPGEILLTAGQQLTVQKSGLRDTPRAVDSGSELAWTEGRLIFENDPVSAVIEDFNRYNRVQLRITDKVLAGRPVSGVFSASDPESFIAFIQTVQPVQVTRRGEDITLSAR